MESRFLKAAFTAGLLAGVGVLLTPGLSSAADVYLQTESYSKALPGGQTVPMWGFVCDPDVTPNDGCVPSASGAPRIEVADGDTLTIHLDNTLSVPVSVVIPGQDGGGDPVWDYDGQGRRRVRSFTHETGAGSTTTPSSETYTWGPLSPGTYLFHSGTQPSLQVPMGLYGALVVGPATGVLCPALQTAAYDDADSCHDAEALLLFSEIDPLQNQRVHERATLVGGTPGMTCESLADWVPGAATDYPCTVDYTPTWFLINGEPYDAAAPPPAVAAGSAGNDVLLRLVNAGLRSHSPAIVGLEMGLVAEDGHRQPGLVKQQNGALLPAGKTLDALVSMPATDATYPIFDRMLDLSNDNRPDGGMLAYLQVGGGSGTPSGPLVGAVDDVFTFDEGTPLDGVNVLTNDIGLAGATVTVVSGPTSATSFTLNPDGTFSYTTTPGSAGTDTFRYNASLGGSDYQADVTLNVSFLNDPPVAAPDTFVSTVGGQITVDAPGVLGNDADADGDSLTAVLDTGGVTLNPDGSFSYSGASTSFTYHAEDEQGAASVPVVVTLTVNPPSGIALTVEDPGGAAVTEYRWLVQEDAMFRADPAAPLPVTEQQSLNFHKSYMPVVAEGHGAAEFAQFARDPSKHYYVSVLPDDAGTGAGHSIGGASIPPGTSAVTVTVNNQPIPTAQVSVLVFEDNAPTNGVPDAPEPRLGGFQITLEDAGGRYGISGGMMMQDAFGAPLKNSLDCFGATPPPMGVILTCPDGTALIKDLPPGKYGVIVDAPAGTSGSWIQTSTIEGTKVQDTWVKAGEPPFFVEAGAPGFHAFIGFVNPDHLVNPGGDNAVSGHVTLLHDPRPPGGPATVDSGSYVGLSHTRAWVGLNSVAGDGPNIATVQADADGLFQFTGIPDGTYQIVVWDTYLDQVIAFQTVDLPAEAGDVGHVPVNNWFARLEHNVFLDENENGIRDEGEVGLPEQAVNIRWRDGTVNQTFPTDTEGFVPFDQVFPFFSWQVAEVDYTRFKPTGVTVTVDGGGDVSGGPYPGLLAPQIGSPRTDTEPSPVLLEAFQAFPGQTSIFEWGKAPYHEGENGGISGIVFHGTTRGENDPRLTVGDPWEPGIPGVTVRLYREVARPDGTKSLALLQEVQTDSWDASQPTGCPGENPSDPFTTQTLGSENITRCYDGWRNWNQVRPGVFDGGYAFTDIPPGKYVVEVVPPNGYQVIKEEDKNVDFGDSFGMAPVAMMLPGGALLAVLPDQAMVLAALAAEPGIAQPPCVGPDHLVPYQLSLFPGVDTYAPFANTMRPLCNRKEVIVSDQGQAAADFHLFTETPVAAQFTGLITDDIASETNPASPGFGEKWSPAYLPFSIRDFNGKEVYRGYSDAFGRYNGILPSTFSANIPIPSGYSPAMMDACLNDPGPLPGGTLDPLRNEAYGTFCYTAQFMPGTTTYLDTPILPTSAFAAGFSPVDCAFPNGTPAIAQVDGSGIGPLVEPGGIIEIRSQGVTTVPNPAYEGPLAPAPYNQPTINRNFGFGPGGGPNRGTVELVESDGTRHTLVTLGGGTGWSPNVIRAVAPDTPMTGELVITRGDNGNRSINTVTVTVSNETPIRVPGDYPTIQAAIDAADANSLILVAPGVYEELVVMWKPVRLQGSGPTTIINASKRPGGKVQAWYDKVQGLVDDGTVDLLPGQPNVAELVGPGLFGTEVGAGITVLAANDPDNLGGLSFISGENPSRIDGFTITGADSGGGIFVNGYAHHLEISNNQVTGNSGTLSGGIRVGHPALPLAGNGPFGFNEGLSIHDNAVTRNGALHFESAGGGLSLYAGTDAYAVSRNFVCGNYTQGDGAGIGHLGLSNNAVIDHNQILFNQSFNQGLNQHGGGLLIAGEPGAPPALTLGSGSVVVDGNLIQGNQAGSGHGGGIRTQLVNGLDWNGSSGWSVSIINNIVVNNVAAWAGAGLSLQDTANAFVVNNTIANNDSTATVGGLTGAGPSAPQPAGISAERHSPLFAAVSGDSGFSNPTLFNNIVWHNRAFSYDGTQLLPVLSPTAVGECATGADYWDLGVLGEARGGPGLALSPTYSILSSTAGYDGTNSPGSPGFLSAYCNGARTLSTPGPMEATAAFGEGGNFLDVRYGPLTRAWPAASPPWNYHIGAPSAAIDTGTSGGPTWDFDSQARPLGGGVDRGADEASASAPGGGGPPGGGQP